MHTKFRPAFLSLILIAFAEFIPAHAQVTSIYLTHMAGGPVTRFDEENRAITFEVVTPSHNETISVDYRVYAGTAEDGKDFIGGSGTLTFQTFEQIKSFTVPLLDDSLFETNETFYIQLTNASPGYSISSPVTAITIIDDEIGYAPVYDGSEKENAGFFEIPITRRGDFDFASSVEAYLEPDTALPGRDYVDQTFTVNFAPGESLHKIRVPLINNTIEDGFRSFRVRLRNPTGGIPIAVASSGAMTIEDNELGYAFRVPPGANDPYLYEGGPEKLILERRGDYDVSSVATVIARAITNFFSPQYWPAATARDDFTAAQFEIPFAPGQTSAEVPLVVFNAPTPESTEWLRLDYSTNLSTSGLGERYLAIRDNEFNPLPVTRLCLGLSDPLVYGVVPLKGGKFLTLSADQFDSTYSITRFTAAGDFDPTFIPISLDGRPEKVVEGPDGKYTVRLNYWRTGGEKLIRLLNDGSSDDTFNPEITGHIYDFEVISNGKVYVTDPLRRLNTDGSIDNSFVAETTGSDQIILDASENLYVKDSIRDWVRVLPTGAIDPSFSLPNLHTPTEMNGVLFRDGSQGFHRLTPTGADDPTFTTITNALVEAAPNSKFYGFALVDSKTWIQRYNANGTLDPTYMRATLDTSWDSLMFRFAMRADHRGFIAWNGSYVDSMNGTSLRCSDGSYGLASVDLDLPTNRIIVEPKANVLVERPDAGSQFISVIRTGDNSAPAKYRYVVTPGSASLGVDYNMPNPEGEISFAAGESRALLPITPINNSQPDSDRTAVISLFADGATVPESTATITIRNDDAGLKILGRDDNTVHLIAYGGELPQFIVNKSEDLVNWQFVRVVPNGVPFDIDITADKVFFAGQGYSGY